MFGRLAPPLALMALIFYLSAQPDLGTGLGVWDTILRKLAHMAEYALLWFLWWRALAYRRQAVAVFITLLYAATDELHQSFVEGRHGTWTDVLIDTVGVTVAVLAVTAGKARVDRARNRRTPTGDGGGATDAARG